MEKALTQTLSDALCKIDALHLERDNLAVELTALQQGVEHERKVVHRRLFGNEKVNYGLSATLQRINNLQQERNRLAVKVDVLHRRMLEKQEKADYERKMIQNKLFGPESSDQTLSEILQRVDKLLHERHSLALEVETLQHSSSMLLERLQGIKHERKMLHKKLFGESWGQDSADQTLGDTLYKIDVLHQEMDTLRQESSIISEKLRTIQHEQEPLCGHETPEQISQTGLSDTLQKIDTLVNAKDSLTMEVHALQQNSKQLLGQLQCIESEKKEICKLLFGRENVHKSMADILRELNALQQERNSLHAAIDSLQQSMQTELQKIHEKLFGQSHEQEGAESTLSNVLQKIDTLHQEKDNLTMEVDKLQQSSYKLHEELHGVEHLRQEVNRKVFGQESANMTLSDAVEKITKERDDLEMEMNTLRGLKQEVITLSSRLMQTEQEREHLSVEHARVKQQIVQLKMAESNLVKEHAKDLERANDLWKKKWPLWSETWEEKSISVPLGTDKLAGFSVVGGRDQPHMPNPGAFIVTAVDAGSPASGVLKVGDILETVNGVNLTYANHREAANAVKESEGILNIVLHRRKHVYPFQVGVMSSLNSIPHEAESTTKVEELECSLCITGREKLGFCYDYSSTYTVTDVSPLGPAFQILQPGDRILKINNVPIVNDKPSAVKKLLKPHNKSLQLVIERQKSVSRPGELNLSLTSHGILKSRSVSMPYKLPEEGPVITHQLHSFKTSHHSNSDHDNHCDTDTVQRLQDSSQQGSKTESSKEFKSRHSVPSLPSGAYAQAIHQHSMSDGPANSSCERRSEYGDLLSTESQFSPSQSGYCSSNGSIDLTFQNSPVSYSSLTVDSVMTTQSQLPQSPLVDNKKFNYLVRDDIPSNPDSGVGSSPCSGGSLGFTDYGHNNSSCNLAPAMTSVIEDGAYTGKRPVMVFGALADQVVASLLEKFPRVFHLCPTVIVKDVSHSSEACLMRDITEGKIVDFWKIEAGFEIIEVEPFLKNSKDKHCLLTGTIPALHSLAPVAPPISILIKANSEESVSAYSTKHLLPDQAREVYEKTKTLEEQHGHEFSALLLLMYMDTLTNEIKKIVKKENGSKYGYQKQKTTIDDDAFTLHKKH